MSHPSPASSATSASPAPATPLTPNSAHVSFAVPSDNQFFDALNLDTNTVQSNNAHSNNNANNTAAGPIRRKPSRRANTAERRATHNAVERQRRETLNGRFLDLAALLPNLVSVRRPSKSAIVNSSIALIHTQRRARSTAARELRMLKIEADQLRAEVNEWRERAGMGLTRIDEPPRSREFEELVSGGLEEAEESHLEEERRALEIVKEGLRLDAAMPGGATGADLMNPFAYGAGNAMFAGLDDDEDESCDGPIAARTRPGSQGSLNGIPQLPMPIAIPRAQTNVSVQQPIIFDPSAAMLQSHQTQNAGIHAAYGYDLPTYNIVNPAKAQANWNAQVFNYQPQNYAANTNFLGNFGLRDDDSTDGSSSVGSVSDMGFHHPGLPRARSASGLASTLQTNLGSAAGSPPSSAPASATTYADAVAAAYAAYPSDRVAGGGSAYGAAMGLFM